MVSILGVGVRLMKRTANIALATIGLLSASCLAQATEGTVNPLQSTAIMDAPIQIVVSRKDQRLKVYRGLEVIATSNVSTGKAGHTTPTGIFSILEKRRTHFSNLYNSAPMPFMQRLTWSGIALHESNSVPRYPASHGCVRLPRGFAKKLFGLTDRGAHVVIAEREAEPELIQHSLLFQPTDKSLSGKVASLGGINGLTLSPLTAQEEEGPETLSLLATKPAASSVSEQVTRQISKLEKANASNMPIRIFITRRAQHSLVRDVQAMLNQLGFEAGDEDGLAGKDTFSAIRRYYAARSGSIEGKVAKWNGVIGKDLLQDLYHTAGMGKIPAGQIFVRQNFKPLFEAPIHIKDRDQPLGAHLFTATAANGDGKQLEWLALALGDKISPKMQASLGVSQDLSKSGLVSSQQVLDRIVIPDYVSHEINRLIGSGSSLSISDKGLSYETGNGTDFIVLTKPKYKARKALAKSKAVKKVRKVVKKRKKPEAERKKVVRRGLFSLFRRDSGS